jgi:hypothetical protein
MNLKYWLKFILSSLDFPILIISILTTNITFLVLHIINFSTIVPIYLVMNCLSIIIALLLIPFYLVHAKFLFEKHDEHHLIFLCYVGIGSWSLFFSLFMVAVCGSLNYTIWRLASLDTTFNAIVFIITWLVAGIGVVKCGGSCCFSCLYEHDDNIIK